MSIQSTAWLGLAWRPALVGLISLAATTPYALAQVDGKTDLVAFQTEVSEEQALEAGVVGTHTLRFSRVAIDPELLRLPGPEDAPPGTWLNTGGSHAIEPFQGERYTVRGRRVEASDDDTWSWVGQVEGYEHGDFVLSVNGEQIYGTLRAGPVTLEFQTGDDGWHYVREPDVDAYGGCAHTGEGHEHEIGAAHSRARSPVPSLPTGVSPSRTVDVLLLYSSAVAGRYDITTLVNNATASMNTAFAESGVDAAVRVVHYHEVSNYSEPDPMDPDADVYGLADSIRDNDPPFAFIDQMRSDYDADLVHMLFDASKSPDACGWGFWFYTNAGDDTAFVSVGGDECISAQNAFAHEIAHNIGGRHDSWLDPDPPLPYTYSNGYSRLSPARRTILGSGRCFMGDCVRLNRWSSPNLYVGGDAMGDPDTADMVSSHDALVPAVADYRTPNASTPGVAQNVDIEPGQCYGLNWLSWEAASGIVGWYEAQASLQTNFSTSVDIYRGPLQSLLAIDVTQTTYVRVRACNSASCSSWVSSSTPASYTNGCL
jgi:hypothetical protein